MTVLTSWGRTLRAECDAKSPLFMAQAQTGFTGACIYGNGRSYGDCALNPGGRALVTQALNRVLNFDAATGILQVEPGVTFHQIVTQWLPSGWMVPVSPGTGFATLGGALANDVHGKNHEHAGTLAQHVTELDLLLPNGSQHTISPADEALFRATAGGLGLTGLITRLAIKMEKLPGGRVRVRRKRVNNLDDFLAAMAESAGATHSVGWIDALAQGANLGRGIWETGESIPGNTNPLGPRLMVPFDFPGWALNSLSVKAFNALYWRRVPPGGAEFSTDLVRLLYPLDALLHWNRIYGSRGFYQFQCVVPFAGGDRVLRDMLTVIAKSGQASFLAVLKRLGGGRGGYLSFPMPGYTLALDFPNKPGIAELYGRLCAMTRDAGGRVYLAKDGLLTADMFQSMYPELNKFRVVLREIDPERRMESAMARRLKIYG
jgi:decaprenylphospho-beta-D-ribofuranose 2-oxidase